MGASPTPWSAVDRYATRYGIIGDEFELLAYGIRILDSALIDYHDTINEQEAKAKDDKAKREAKAKQKGRR